MTEIIIRENTEEENAKIEDWASKEYEREVESVKQIRQSTYQKIADPLFFKWQAGEATEQEWKDARASVVEQYPYPDKTNNQS
jgi:hypothetical protein